MMRCAPGLDPIEAKDWKLSMSQSDQLVDLNGQNFNLNVDAEFLTTPALPILNGGSFLSLNFSNDRHHQPTHRQTIESETYQEFVKESETNKSRRYDRYRLMERLKSTNCNAIQHPENQQQSEQQQHFFKCPSTIAEKTEWGKMMGLSNSALNSRYFSQQNLKGQVRATDSQNDSQDDYKTEHKTIRGRSDPDGGSNLSDDMNDYSQRPTKSAINNNTEGHYNACFMTAASIDVNKKFVERAVSSTSAFIETRNLEASDRSNGESSTMSDTSDTVSLSLHVRRVRVPSQSTDMDQYLDELFMPILDSNKDMECDACLVAASIKEGAHSKKETDTVDSIFNDVTDAIVDDQQPLSDAETLASFIKCSGYEEESRDQHNQGYMKSTPDSISASASPFQSIGINRLIIRQLQQGAMAPHHDTSFELVSSETLRIYDPSPIQPNDGKHSLLQFSLYHFRQGPANCDTLQNGAADLSNDQKIINKKSKISKKFKNQPPVEPLAVTNWTWKAQVDLVKFSKSPIQVSLLQLETNEVNKLALENFMSIMKYMGDYPMKKEQSEVDCVCSILMNCRKHESLKDETYCQIMKQMTNNKSSQPDSCQRGWRLFSIIAAYFSCSEVLKPYLFKYLKTVAYDKRRAYHGTAMLCLQNFLKTLRYGGRKNLPSIEEITAITAGRNSKRQMYRLPDGTKRVINTSSTSVVQNMIKEICAVIDVHSANEIEEYSLYCIVEGDSSASMRLSREEYILDVTTELQKNQQVYYLIFCRSVWHYSMRLDNTLYIEIVFNQIASDYLEGLLLVVPSGQMSQDCIDGIAKVAALLHRSANLNHMPSMKETMYLLPKLALSVSDITLPQWVNLVQRSWRGVKHLKTSQAKSQVLEFLEKWPLFGSSFFAVRRNTDSSESFENIMALNSNGIHFLDVFTHETLMHYPFSEVLSTRKVKSNDKLFFLDIKCGNLWQQRVTRIQSDQAHEISRLIRHYITIQKGAQHHTGRATSVLR